MLSLIRKILPAQIISRYHMLLAWFGAILYGFPSRSMTIIGVTGTNGKSTVVYLLARMFEASGKRAAASSSIEFQIAELHWPNTYKMTMPGRFFLQRFLRKAARSGCTHAVLEVTSEGLAQYRHRFIDFDVAVFLNISPEHIERHGSYEAYREAKGQLFQALNSNKKIVPHTQKYTDKNTDTHRTVSIVNVADKEAGYFLQFPADRYVGFRVGERNAVLPQGGKELAADEVQQGASGLSFTVQGVPFSSPLLGEMNVENILAAITIAYAAGISLKECAEAVRHINAIPGRLEEIPSDRGFRIFVDYAHNPVALQKAYETLSENFQIPALPAGRPNPKSQINPKSQPIRLRSGLRLRGSDSRRLAPSPSKGQIPKPRLICVLGAAGGGRDMWKRPKLGELAAQYCDRIILTDEDPYDEKPLKIIEDIERGFSQTLNPKPETLKYEKILDRREAIQKAIGLAQPGDVMIITGKGCEPWMMVAHGKKVPWDDRDVVRTALREYHTR